MQKQFWWLNLKAGCCLLQFYGFSSFYRSRIKMSLSSSSKMNGSLFLLLIPQCRFLEAKGSANSESALSSKKSVILRLSNFELSLPFIIDLLGCLQRIALRGTWFVRFLRSKSPHLGPPSMSTITIHNTNTLYKSSLSQNVINHSLRYKKCFCQSPFWQCWFVFIGWIGTFLTNKM